MTTFSNRSNIPLSLAVFLASDNYDYNQDAHTISVTTLLKPTRQIILGARVPEELGVADISGLVQARMGQAIHDAIERSWTENHQGSLKALGYPAKVIDLVLINPTAEQLYDGCIPIYLEQREARKLGKWLITGKYDFIGDGRVEDFKSTSTFTWTNNTKDEDYILQGSFYRWLNPQKVTQDVMAIQFIFTDWSALRARSEKNYPPQRTMERVLTLRPLAEVERYASDKLHTLETLWDAPQEDLPLCSDKELWRSAPVWKYYKNPANDKPGGRSTKNFDNALDAQLILVSDGNVGKVKEVPGSPMACKYCKAFPICTQAARMVASGDLIL